MQRLAVCMDYIAPLSLDFFKATALLTASVSKGELHFMT
jgi:hypothetical protein